MTNNHKLIWLEASLFLLTFYQGNNGTLISSYYHTKLNLLNRCEYLFSKAACPSS